MSQRKPQELRIAIIGGGPGGLSTAIALWRGGFKNVTVYERDTDADARKQGYSFTLFGPAGGLPFLKKLGLLESMKPFAFEATGFRIMDASTGKAILSMSRNARMQVTESRRVSRSGLRKLLVKVCNDEGVPVIWNAKFSSYEELNSGDGGVVLHFDGQEDKIVDLLIGADGIHSYVRKQLIGDPIIYSGFAAIMYTMTRSDNPELFEHPWINGAGGFTLGGKESMFFYHHPPTDMIHWSLTMKVPEGEISQKCQNDQQKLYQLASEFAKKFPDNQLIQGMVKGTKPGDASVIEFRDRTPLKIDRKTGRLCLSKTGCITLLGDAAHPMTPFQAAGGNNALMDASKLTEELHKLLSLETVTLSDIHRVLSIYEKEMGPRGAKAIQTSRRSAESVHSTNQFHIFFRNALFRAVSWKLNYYEGSWLKTFVKTLVVGAVVASVSYAAVHYNVVHRLQRLTEK